MLYDLFICHASEDKKSFVRPLADALKAKNVEAWYDEFSLKLRDSIRRTLDKGLKQSRFGVVVLSKAFFKKEWPQYELDGLAEREMKGRDKLILPIWHDVTHDDILAYSPSLAGRRAVLSSEGLEKVVDEILDVVRPQGSPLIVARDIVIEWGLTPPVITDEYWLRVVEASNRLPGFGPTIPDESIWSRWSFPLPPKGETAQNWGERLAWTAMQQDWVADADKTAISVTTPPDRVLSFIADHPGLSEICETYPGLAAEYAPQLTIPGIGGPLESIFEEEYQKSKNEYAQRRVQNSRFGTGLTKDRKPPLCDETWCLRSPTFGNYDSVHVSYQYFGHGMFRPNVAYHDDPDHAFWLLSRASLWIPKKIHDVLLNGMRRWITWLWGPLCEDKDGEWKNFGTLSKVLSEAIDGKPFRWNDEVKDDVLNRIQLSKERMNLPEDVSTILERFLDQRFIENYIKTQRGHRRRNSNSAERRNRVKKRAQ